MDFHHRLHSWKVQDALALLSAKAETGAMSKKAEVTE